MSKSNKIREKLGLGPLKKPLFGNNRSLDTSIPDVTTSYDVYKKRTKRSFELLDRIKNSNIYKLLFIIYFF